MATIAKMSTINKAWGYKMSTNEKKIVQLINNCTLPYGSNAIPVQLYDCNNIIVIIIIVITHYCYLDSLACLKWQAGLQYLFVSYNKTDGGYLGGGERLSYRQWLIFEVLCNRTVKNLVFALVMPSLFLVSTLP